MRRPTPKFVWLLGFVMIFSMITYGLLQARAKGYFSGNDSLPKSFPGEFEPQQAVWIMWPSANYNRNNQPVNPVMADIIKALTPYIQVNIMSDSQHESDDIQKILEKSGCFMINIHYYIIKHRTIWARDVGPVFVKDGNNKLKVVNFGFNQYGRYGGEDYVRNEAQVDKNVAQVLGLPIVNTSLISEGGAIESNGRGVIITTESVALKRNPTMTKQQIEEEYCRVLGLKKVIWLKRGLAEDNGITSGHVDEIARFADPHTILLAQVLPEDRHANWASEASYLNLEEDYTILENATDQEGNPFRIIRIPMPPTLYHEAKGEIPVRSYLNYTVSNGVVLMQTYWKPGRSDVLKQTEDEVREIFQSVFPDRSIIGINAENINQWGGGIHCVTQTMPAN